MGVVSAEHSEDRQASNKVITAPSHTLINSLTLTLIYLYIEG